MKHKRILTVLLIAVMASFNLFAAWTVGDFSFSIAPGEPLFKESRSYPFSNVTTFRYMFSTPEEEFLPTTFLVSDKSLNDGRGGYKELPFDTFDKGHSNFWHLKAAINTGVLRFSYGDWVKAEMYIHGGLNTVFTDYGGTNVLGFDGMYGLGMTLGICDVAYFRFGAHHFSGHWGDEMMKKFEERNPGFDGELLEYTRNNSYFFDLSIEPVKYFRLLVGAELPIKKAWIRPSAHVPEGTISPGYEDSQVEHIENQEHVRRKEAYPASYKGWRISLGAEAEYPVKGAGNVFVSYDFEMHQDGKINLETLEYDDARPWETEHTVAMGFEFEDEKDDPSFTVEFSYHYGRFPLLNYFFQKSEYMGVGLTASF